MDIMTNKTLSGRLRELKNKEKFLLGNPKSGRGRLRELSLREIFITKSQFKRGFRQRWSQLEPVSRLRRASTVMIIKIGARRPDLVTIDKRDEMSNYRLMS